MNYCTHCASPLVQRVSSGDDRTRHMCDVCGTIHYQNPKMVVGTIPRYRDRVLLCRRAIEPRYGFWTLPAGYLESGESLADGARRETLEEAGTSVDDLIPFAVYNITFVSQIYFMFLADMVSHEFSAGHESLDVQLFHERSNTLDGHRFYRDPGNAHSIFQRSAKRELRVSHGRYPKKSMI